MGIWFWLTILVMLGFVLIGFGVDLIHPFSVIDEDGAEVTYPWFFGLSVASLTSSGIMAAILNKYGFRESRAVRVIGFFLNVGVGVFAWYCADWSLDSRLKPSRIILATNIFILLFIAFPELFCPRDPERFFVYGGM